MSRVKCKKPRPKYLEDFLDFYYKQAKLDEMIVRINDRLKMKYGSDQRVL